jgi:hypothetical protein
MEWLPKEVTIREVSNGYLNNGNNGVRGYDGKLNIRPEYQREYVYKGDRQKAVIETIQQNAPLNNMYWAINEDGTYEVLDGQQRIISICEYIENHFSVNYSGEEFQFHNLTKEEQEQILNYKLMVHTCEGNNREKLNWFQRANIAGLELSRQEVRNAIYTGTWVTSAKAYFSKIGCKAHKDFGKYMKGEYTRQDYLETAIKWINNGKIENYMEENQHKPNADELQSYFKNIMAWVEMVFPKYYNEMKGLPWGVLYNKFKDDKLDTNKLEDEIARLMQDEDVTNKKGIYEYVLTREEKCLSIRAFTPNQKREAYERQEGICPQCKEENRNKQHFEIEGMEGDHWYKPWHEGGHTTPDNCMMLCKEHNRTKSGK